MKSFKSAFAAGFMISIGAACFLSCKSKIIGALLFCVALFTICVFNLDLYTGMVGYFFEIKNKLEIFIVWLGNLAGGAFGTVLLRAARHDIFDKATVLVTAKLNQSLLQTAVLALFCGVLMFIAIHNNKTNKSDIHRLFGLIVCIMTFILCGFEHSIADICYFWFSVDSVELLLRAVWYVLLVSVFNAIGAIMFNELTKNAENAAQ